jgi:hypothetical protein
MEEVRNKDDIVSLLITCMQLALRLCFHAVRWTQKVLTQCWKTEKEKQTMTRKERRFQTLRERKKGKKTRRESHRQRFALRRLQASSATKHGPATAWVCDLQTWKVAYGCFWLCAEFILVLSLLRAVECVLGAIVPATVASVTAVSALMLYFYRPFLRRLNASWRAFGKKQKLHLAGGSLDNGRTSYVAGPNGNRLDAGACGAQETEVCALT